MQPSDRSRTTEGTKRKSKDIGTLLYPYEAIGTAGTTEMVKGFRQQKEHFPHCWETVRRANEIEDEI